MKLEYNVPQIRISAFSRGNIITLSGEGTQTSTDGAKAARVHLENANVMSNEVVEFTW